MIYLIVGGIVLGIIIAFSEAGLFKKGKKSAKKSEPKAQLAKKSEPKAKPAKKNEAKPQQPKAEEPKKEEKPEKDRSFNIVKKSRLSRVSKKALSTNSRTGTVERVFERTPEAPKEEPVIIDVLEQHNEDLLQSVKDVEIEGKKVVSITELMQKAEEKVESAAVEKYSEPVKEKTDAGFVSGDYFGIHIGSSKRQPIIKAEKDEPIEPVSEKINELNSEFGNIFKRGTELGISGLDRFKNFNKPADNNDGEEDPLDLNNIIIADAILNPKYKNKK